MHSIRDAHEHTLRWQQQQPYHREYQLCSDTHVFAALRWLQAFGSLAQADTSDGQWTFKRIGFWRPRISIRLLGAANDLVVFEPSRTGIGTIMLPHARQMRWSTTGGTHTRWAWYGPSGEPLLHFAAIGSTHTGTATIESSAFALPDLALLVSLGWYLLILQIDDASAGVSAS